MDNTTLISLDELNDAVVKKLLAPVVYLFILLVVGIPGNILVVIIYRNRNKNAYQAIIWIIGIVDLCFCVVGIPFNLARLFNYYKFTELRVCQIVVSILDSGIATSTHLLMLLTLHRFRQVCMPLQIQITLQNVYYFIAMCFGIGLAFGIPQIAVLQPLEEVHFNNTNVTGYICSVAWKNSPDYWRKYNTFLTILFLFYAFVLFVLYILIGRSIYKQGKKCDTKFETSNKSSTSTDLSNKMTKIAFTVSAVFALSYVPLFINEIATKHLKEDSLNAVEFSLLKIVQRSYLINHVANPFIYAIFDEQFRQHLKTLTMSVVKCRKITITPTPPQSDTPADQTEELEQNHI